MNMNLLKAAVYSRGITMQQMTEQAGITYSTLLRDFKQNNMPLVRLKKIKNVLNLSREEMLSIFFES